MAELHLTGTFTALVTPFSPDGETVDRPALEALVEAQIAGGVSGLVPCGSTGEAPTLTDEEQISIVRCVVAVARRRVPVLAGTGSFSTKKTVAASKAAIAAGADGVMIVMPYYNRPSQDGLREHTLAVARAIASPVVLYNIPGRSVVDLSAETTERICLAAPNVIGIKDATGNILRCQELKRRMGDRLSVMSGDDALTLGMMACGADGVISVTSNVLPREVSEVTRLAGTGDYGAARVVHLGLLDIHALMFAEPSPAPVKAALAARGRVTLAVRPPLAVASEGLRRQLADALTRFGDGSPQPSN